MEVKGAVHNKLGEVLFVQNLSQTKFQTKIVLFQLGMVPLLPLMNILYHCGLSTYDQEFLKH